MAVSQTLSVTEVAGSPSTETNTSKVRILWQSTQTGESYNGYTRTAKYWISINGAAGVEHTVSYTLPKGTTKTILDTTITVPHKDDGSGTVTVATWMDTDISAGVIEKSQSLTLTTIARASVIDSAANVTLGNACSVKWTPKSAAFRYKLKFAFGSWSYTTGAIHPNKTSAYTYTGYVIPLDVANQIPNTRTGKMTVTLYTYSNSGATTQVGSADSETFTITVPDNSSTKPVVSMDLSPVGSLPSAFAGLYIQGMTKVKAALSADGQYGADINTYHMKVDGVYHDADDAYTSGYFATAGIRTVYGYATDYRGHTGENLQQINVIAYSDPKLENATAIRCDKDGNASESGTYLKLQAKRSYSPVVSDDEQRNFCKIEYQCLQDGNPLTQWATILAADSLDSDEVTTSPLLGGTLSTQLSYVVHIKATDDIGRYAETFITVPTAKVYWHRDGARNALGLGKYNERDNAVDSDWDFYLNGHKVTGLPTPVDDTDAVPKAYAAPADVQMKKALNAEGWYKLGTITAGMCSMITLTIGGQFQNNQTSPSVVDIATQYNTVRAYTILPALVENQLSKIGVIIESALKFGVYAYYNSALENPIHINVHPSMGQFQAEDWVVADVADSDMAAVVSLTAGLLSECIAEEWTDGIWKCRKWADGTAECRGIYVQENVNVATAWESLYESNGFAVDLPSGLFVETPQFSITLAGSRGALLTVFSEGTVTQTPHMCAVRPNAVTIETLNTSIVAYGRWK